MEYFGLSLLSGVLTVLSPCVLPLLPVIIGGSLTNQHKSRPWIITGSLVVSIVLFTLLLKVSTAFINVDPRVWTVISGGLVIGFGIVNLFPSVWEKFSGRFNLSGRSDELLQASAQKQSWVGSVLVGLSLGPVFSSCSPTYAIILATVLPQNFFAGLVNLIIYAVGLSLMLLLVGIFGQRIVKKLRWAADPHGWFRKVLGVIFIIVGVTILSGYEKHLEAYLLEKSWFNATTWEFSFLDDMPVEEKEILKQLVANPATIRFASPNAELQVEPPVELSIDQPYAAPEFTNIDAWINSDGETMESLKGKVVLIDFWTYSCINCIRTLPFLKEWNEKYKDDGLVIVGVHAPEFAFEHVPANVQAAVNEYGIEYPVALDNDFETWLAYDNHYWPAKYFIDRDGNVRHTHFGEGDYSESEEVIRYLLSEGGSDIEDPMGSSEGDVAPIGLFQTPETYLGYSRGDRFANAEDEDILKDEVASYTLHEDLEVNEWSLGGDWKIEDEKSTSQQKEAQLRMQFSAKDVYLVMASPQPATVQVSVNGEVQPDVEVTASNLYHLVNLDDSVFNATLDLTFPKGVEIYAFTFGGEVPSE